MSNKIVIISDTHFGEEEANLQNPKILTDFIKTINELKIDKLILLGDILDLSLSSFKEAIPQFQNFLNKLANETQLKEIVYVIGNHDHHLLLLEIEYTQIIQRLKRKQNLFFPLSYITEISLKDSILSEIFPQQIAGKLIYPNYSFKIKEKSFFLHHGHNLSTVGGLLCTIEEALKENKSPNEFELENSAIHELIQYHLEQSHALKNKIESAWEKKGAVGTILVVLEELLNIPYLFKILSFFIKTPHIKRGSKINKVLQRRIINYIRLNKQGCDYFIFGHTHVAEVKKIKDLCMINVGSWTEKNNIYLIITDKISLQSLLKKEVIWEEKL